MSQKDESAEDREGLLRHPEAPDDRYSMDSLDEREDFLASEPPKDVPRAPVRAYHYAEYLSNLRKAAAKTNKYVLICLLVGVTVWSIVVATGYWIYKQVPPHGLSPPWYPTPLGGTVDSWAESYRKASEMVSRMTLPEKVNVTTGTGWMMGLAVGNTGPAIHVGFPSLALQDGPLGIRNSDHATAFPAGITVGATWNKKLMYQRGKAHGKEARLKGVNVLLGPCVGPLGRMPAAGRNWESFGADPYLQGIAAAETIKGIQSEGIMATIKHYIGNEQEHYRQSWEWALPNALSSNIGDRTLHELYLWPFQDAVRAGVASVMCSYQMTNNSYSCGNSKLLNSILKDELGFQGFVQSDWLAQRSGVASALAGLDMSMPGDGLRWQDGKSLWGPEMTKAVLNGSLPLTRLNDMVTRVVAAWYQLGQDDESRFDRKGPNFSSWTDDAMGRISPGSPDDQDLVRINQYVDVQGEGADAHAIIARWVAVEGTVLLKNEENVLPFARGGRLSQAISEAPQPHVGIYGLDAGPGEGPNVCPDRACNKGTLGSGWGSGAVEFPYLVAPSDALKDAFDKGTVVLTEHLTNSLPSENLDSKLKDQDLCLVFAMANSGEGFASADGVRGDRNDLNLQLGGDALILDVANGCGGGKGKTVVVIHSVGPVTLEKWIDHQNIKAVVWSNLPGQESGNALVDILFGDITPSGKLPYTIGRSLDDYGGGAKVMYYANGALPQQDFDEGIYIDYRHFDRYDIEPRYEFGYGLSYTTFKYTNLRVTTVKPKSRLPALRSDATQRPPSYPTELPEPSSALFPEGFRQLRKYIYPYINGVKEIGHGKYPYPKGYDTRQAPSQAGGGEGGNPSLWDIHVRVSVNITNSGNYSGSEVVQLYVSYPEAPAPSESTPTNTKWHFDTDVTDFPVKVLRGFEKVFLSQNETKTVEFELTRRDLSYWDVREQNWVMPVEREFRLRVGASSRDLRLEGNY